MRNPVRHMSRFVPDGRRALALARRRSPHLACSASDGSKVEDTKQFMVAGIRPLTASRSASKGDVARVDQPGRRAGRHRHHSDDRPQGRTPPRIVDTASVEQIAEGAAMSPDGNFVAVTMQNGSNKAPSNPSYHKNSVLKLSASRQTNWRWWRRANSAAGASGWPGARTARRCLLNRWRTNRSTFLPFDGKTLKKTGNIKVNGRRGRHSDSAGLTCSRRQP